MRRDSETKIGSKNFWDAGGGASCGALGQRRGGGARRIRIWPVDLLLSDGIWPVNSSRWRRRGSARGAGASRQVGYSSTWRSREISLARLSWTSAAEAMAAGAFLTIDVGNSSRGRRCEGEAAGAARQGWVAQGTTGMGGGAIRRRGCTAHGSPGVAAAATGDGRRGIGRAHV